MTLLKYFFFFILFISSSFAADSIAFSPAKTSSQGNKVVILNEGTKIYLIHNVSAKSIWIDHPTKKQSASAGWASFITPGNWSALLIDKKNFIISCSQIKPGEVVDLNCNNTIAVFLYPISTQKKGTYWLVENKSYNDLLKLLSHKH